MEDKTIITITPSTERDIIERAMRAYGWQYGEHWADNIEADCRESEWIDLDYGEICQALGNANDPAWFSEGDWDEVRRGKCPFAEELVGDSVVEYIAGWPVGSDFSDFDEKIREIWRDVAGRAATERLHARIAEWDEAATENDPE